MVAATATEEEKLRHNLDQQDRYWQRKAWMIEYLGGQCAVCGTTYQLRIDHIDPELKAFNLTECWSWSKERLEAELDKCQLLCKPHHDLKTALEQGKCPGGSHVTGTQYNKGCRCETCVKNHNKRNMRYRLSKQFEFF